MSVIHLSDCVSVTDQIARAHLRIGGWLASAMIEEAVAAGVHRPTAEKVVGAYTNDMLSDLFFDLRKELKLEAADDERRCGRIW